MSRFFMVHRVVLETARKPKLCRLGIGLEALVSQAVFETVQ